MGLVRRTTIPNVIFLPLLVLTFLGQLIVPVISRIIVPTSNPSSFIRTTKAVKLSSGNMEIINEIQCSNRVLRLTCRSLRAFIFVLEAEYQPNRTEFCGYQSHMLISKKNKFQLGNNKRVKDTRQLRGNYIKDEEEDERNLFDVRASFNRKCSGQHHCRYNLSNDHPGTTYWHPAAIKFKYACVPEIAVCKYCNVEVKIPKGEEGGYLKSPGYPLYYPGGYSCGWTFKSSPGERIVLTFHDLNIRSPESNGTCVDVVKIRENGNTLFERCGIAAGITIISNSNLVTLDLIASTRLYPARGFLLQYQVLRCPNVSAPNGSYISNDTVTSRTFSCKSGTVFPDTRKENRILECKNGKWNESIDKLPTCVATSAVILKTENEQHHLSSLSGDNVVGAGVRIGRGEGAIANENSQIMDSAQSAMMKQADYVVDVVLPTVLIALLFVGNAIIVYIIFQYRKRKIPTTEQGEELALRNTADVPQV
ncbi:PREDICTED: uncharacterized protein LOC107074367 isoform X2 [Polistes dominula]|uniref:Uncharacterized protein LOC107074367 isoform X2 n=1 Tax=Polistes dominula TaxID=743375 RepID=A0ABM1JFI4_POLDO|nr:PREDICTED: uncharacterized protein LOC107074367 isoform X2 [Polistes dominula]